MKIPGWKEVPETFITFKKIEMATRDIVEQVQILNK